MSDLSLEDFKNIISDNESTLLVGNGFSMNFDRSFGKIYDRLYDAHCEIVNGANEYKVHREANKQFKNKCKQNYKSILKFTRYFNKENFERLFMDGILFACSVADNYKLIEELTSNNYITSLVFGISEYDVLLKICESKGSGYKCVNIEHWTLLIKIYFAIKKLNSSIYRLPDNNLFINAIRAGDENKLKLTNEDLIENTLFNGFSIYIRFLFSIAIFAEGKSIDLNKLENIQDINIDGLKEFLNNFTSFGSMNYDHILDNLLENQTVIHPHGIFVKDKIEYVYNQSLGLKYGDDYISLSDLIIGDYFTYKVNFLTISELSAKQQLFNKRGTFTKKIKEILAHNNTLVIFGLSIENDYHILRHILIELYSNEIESPRIIYCYYNDEDKTSFESVYQDLNTFSDELSKYVKNVDLCFIKTQIILNNFFKKPILN